MYRRPICRSAFTIALPVMRLGPRRAHSRKWRKTSFSPGSAGGRIMELKTVQVNDELKISRPCIEAANVGYNIEWSQELRVPDSLEQYVAGAMLIHMLRHAPDVFGNPFGDVSMAGTVGEPIYDMSIGYDLAGIQTPKVVNFIRGMIDARETVDRLRDQIPRWLAPLRELDYPTHLSRSITLSTFHGCPAGEIERICEFLLTELDVHVIIKMNPPMLGRDRLEHLLYDVMGYTDVRVNEKAYTSGLQFDESLEICGRLSRLAASRNLQLGAKFSNTLEVENHSSFFQPIREDHVPVGRAAACDHAHARQRIPQGRWRRNSRSPFPPASIAKTSPTSSRAESSPSPPAPTS